MHCDLGAIRLRQERDQLLPTGPAAMTSRPRIFRHIRIKLPIHLLKTEVEKNMKARLANHSENQASSCVVRIGLRARQMKKFELKFDIKSHRIYIK